MTIAICYLSREGAVLGADSMTTGMVRGARKFERFLDHGQKIFEIGNRGSFGVVGWGSEFSNTSLRTIAARLGDDLADRSASSALDVAERLQEMVRPFWDDHRATMDSAVEAGFLSRAQADANGAGFCVAGRRRRDREPNAAIVEFAVGAESEPTQLSDGFHVWPPPSADYACRVLHGFDGWSARTLREKWSGDPADLEAILASTRMRTVGLPIRDAIELVDTVIAAVVQVYKLNEVLPTIGGQVEIALLTSDRPFRWIRHKSFEMTRQPIAWDPSTD